MKPQAKYYIYELIDPRDMMPFYVGKGSGKRIHNHEKEAAKGVCSPKCNKINDIINSGYWPLKRKIASAWNEIDAYGIEAQWIAYYGIENLTNIVGKNKAQENKWDSDIAVTLIKENVKNFATWYKFVNFNKVEIKAAPRNVQDKVYIMLLDFFYNTLAPKIFTEALKKESNKIILNDIFKPYNVRVV